MKIVDIKYKLAYLRSYIASVSMDIKSIFRKTSKMEDYKNIFIRKMYFEITNICNAKCTFCAYRKLSNNRKIGIMSFDIFKKALDDYKKMGGEIISLTPTVGDPLIDPGLLKKIYYAVNDAKIKKVYFYTNGILLYKDDLYKKLIDSGIHRIDISTQGCDKKLFEKVYGVPLYDQLIKGINALLDYNKQKGEPVSISIDFRSAQKPSEVLNSDDFINNIKPFLSKKVGYSFMVDYDNWGGNINQSDLVGVMKLRRKPRFKKTPCFRTFDASVLFDGSVRLCACRIKDTEFDDLIVGNITKNSLQEIYYGEEALKVRKSFTENKCPSTCVDCSLYVPATKTILNKK